ncbi:hypothetical protein ACJMK2_029539, partial [Sinanodonta woodiana]
LRNAIKQIKATRKRSQLPISTTIKSSSHSTRLNQLTSYDKSLMNSSSNQN